MTRDHVRELHGEATAAAPSPLAAAERLVDTAQRLVVERMELLRVETEARVLRGLRAVAIAAVGYSLLVVGWTALVAALVLAVPAEVRVPTTIALAVGHLIVGAIVTTGAARRAAAGR
jgi:uncharacterized membrane protein YqjE